jgi:hypothetical protein
MKQAFGSLMMVVLLLSTAGCSIRLGDFTGLSTKNVPIMYTQGSTVEGRDCKFNVLGVPLGHPNLKDAIDQAIGSRGNALVNEVTYVNGWTAILFGQQCYEVKGEVTTVQ